MKNLLVLITMLSAGLNTSLLRAELDPELAGATVPNTSGFFIGAGASVGQAYSTDGSNPGLAYFVNVEPGYVASRDSWGRVETSGELFYGSLSYREKSDPDLSVTIGAIGLLAKIGYGTSLGSGSFGVFKLGVGPVSADYTGTGGGVTIKSDGAMPGVAAQLAYDLVFQGSENLEFVGSFRWTHIAMDLDDVKSGGVKSSVDEPININLPMLGGGVRFKF